MTIQLRPVAQSRQTALWAKLTTIKLRALMLRLQALPLHRLGLLCGARALCHVRHGFGARAARQGGLRAAGRRTRGPRRPLPSAFPAQPQPPLPRVPPGPRRLKR